jgi:glycosyltransferase involved in cell wall biosynthesis
MKVALISTPNEAIPPVGYGGTERVVADLAEGLVSRGHDVTVFARSDSRTPARVVAYVPKVYHVARAFAASASFDVAHNHLFAGIKFGDILDRVVLHTIHASLTPRTLALARSFASSNFVALSRSHARSMPGLNIVEVIYNGVDTDRLVIGPPAQKGGYLLHMATMSQRKGTHTAARLAHAVRRRMILAGPIARSDQAFFEANVAPWIDGTVVRHVGEVGGDTRLRLIQGADAAVFPLEWEEPFGLAMVEAMSCGVPVIAYRRGSMSEVVAHGRSGFLVSDFDGLVDAFSQLSELRPESCREHVVQNFGRDRMVDRYIALYEGLIRQRAGE